jgi:hypothetical protein
LGQEAYTYSGGFGVPSDDGSWSERGRRARQAAGEEDDGGEDDDGVEDDDGGERTGEEEDEEWEQGREGEGVETPGEVLRVSFFFFFFRFMFKGMRW